MPIPPFPHTQPRPTAQSFIADKQRFFARQLTPRTAKQLAHEHSFSFLALHERFIELEIAQLLALLDNKTLNSSEHALYAYYCCIMLSTHYDDKMYPDPAKKNYYDELAKRIANTLEPQKTHPAPPRHWQAIMAADLRTLLSIPAHSSHVRGLLTAASAYRIVFTFSNVIVQKSLIVLRETTWIRHLLRFSLIPAQSKQLDARLNALSNIMRPLSVLFFLARLLLDLGVIIKHTLFANANEQQLTLASRLYLELKKNYLSLLNDLVWAVLNGLSNYSRYLGLSIPVVNVLMTVGFISDMSLIFCRMREARHDYLCKKTQYTLELSTTQDPTRRRVLEQQLRRAEITYKATQDTLNLNLAAGLLILLGFALPLLLTSPVLILLSYALTFIGIALYLSAEAYSVYREKTYALADKQEIQNAWNGFALSLILNISIPLLLVGVLAVSWQASLCLLVVAAVYAYSRRLQTTPEATTEDEPERALSMGIN